MNRFRKEEQRRLSMENIGLPSSDGSQIETMSHVYDAFVPKVAALHQDLFPEEYNFMLDSGVDIKMRKQGVSPMSKDYLKRTNFRRVSLGMPEISGLETSLSEESWDFSLKKVLAEQTG